MPERERTLQRVGFAALATAVAAPALGPAWLGGALAAVALGLFAARARLAAGAERAARGAAATAEAAVRAREAERDAACAHVSTLEATLDSFAQGVLAVDADGRVTVWNRRVVDLLELPASMLGSRPRLADVVRWQAEGGEFGAAMHLLAEGPREATRRIIAGDPEAASQSYRRTRPDGTVLDVQTHRAAGGGFVRTYTDVSAAVRAEAALIAARDEAEQANRAKAQFLSRMSHELRTPLNAVLGFAQLVDTDPREPPTPTQRARIAEILRGGRELLAMVDEVLEIAAAEAKADRATAPAAPGAAQRCVLYIEDNAVNQVLMQGMLAHRPSIRLLVADDPQRGLDVAAAERPDLVLLDIHLPGIDGYEVLRRLRRGDATRSTPVVAVSANALPEDVEQARQAGFADYLTKPLDLRRLLEVVDGALGVR